MKATLHVYLGKKDELYLLSEVMNKLENFSEDISSKSFFEGYLKLEQTGQEVVIIDELSPLVNNFCFGALLSLLRSSTGSMPYFNASGNVILKTMGHDVEISGDIYNEEGDEIMPVTFNQKEMVTEVFKSGCMYLEFLMKIFKDHSAGSIPHLLKQKNEVQVMIEEKYGKSNY